MVSSLSRKFCVVVLTVLSALSVMQAQDNTTISCVGNFNLSLNACETEITPGMVSAGPIANPSMFTVTLRDEHGVVLDPPNVVTGEHKGTEITYTLVNNSTNNSCWGVLRAEDKIAPVIVGCQPSGVLPIGVTSCFSFADFDLTMSGLATDNCDPNPDIVILDEYIEEDFCDGDILKTIVRVIRAVDNCDNESLPCRVIIPISRVLPFELLELDPAMMAGFVPPIDTIIKCEQVDPLLFPDNLDFNGNPDPVTLSGVPVFQINPGNQYPLIPFDSDSNCELSVIFSDDVRELDRCFTKIIRTWTILENCLINPREISFEQNITIMDMEAPTISGVPDKLNFSTNSASSEICAAITPVPVPVLADNCQDTDDLTLFVLVNGLLPMIEYTGQALTFNDGQNTLEYIGTDGCFNSAIPGINEVRVTVDVWVEDNAPPTCEIDDKAITINNDTGQVRVPAVIFDKGSSDDCSQKVKIFADRENDDCDCSPEDALDRYSDFIYLGRRNGSDYYLSETEVIAPKALNIGVAMGGFVASFANGGERNFVRTQIEEYISNTNPPITELTYFVTNDNQDFPSSLGWDAQQDFNFLMGTTGVTNLQPFDGLTERKRFVVEVEDLCGFSEQIRFCCADVIDDPTVTFRVMDEWGNFNTCDLTVDIQDKVAPLIQCPPEMTVLCSDFLDDMDLAQFGDPTSTDACPAIVTELDPDISLTACNTGTIIRTFEITSGTGTQTCTQNIEVLPLPLEEFADPIDPLDINLPEDAALLGVDPEQCYEGDNIAFLDPFADGFPMQFIPQFDNERVCADLSISFEDDIFEVPNAGANSCFKLVRHWLIVSACDPMNIDTLYEHNQTIIISNLEPPTINFTNAPEEVCNEKGDDFVCPGDYSIRFQVRDDCTARGAIETMFFLDLDCDGTFDDAGVVNTNPATSTLNFTDLPVGNHKVIIEATDGCNNVNSGVHNFAIINCVPPIAACQSLSTALHCFPVPPPAPLNNGTTLEAVAVDCDENGTISDDEQELYIYACAWAEDFAPLKGESFHPCGLPVVYSFSADTTDVQRCFTCTDLRCPQEVTIFVTDPFGNSDMCVATIEFTDNKNLCPPVASCVIPPMVTQAELDTICIGGSSLPIDLSEFGIDSPTIDATCCDDPNNSIDVDEMVLSDDADGCRVIRRTTTVFTDCGCPMTEVFVQTFTVRNDEAPELICPNDVTVDANLAPNANRDCGARVNLDAATVGNCQTDVTITNDFTDSFGANIGNIRYDIGVTTVTFTATNECGDMSTCETIVTVQDTMPPAFVCVTDPIPIQLADGSLTLEEQDVMNIIFTTFPTDVCDEPNIVFDPPTLSCDDISTEVPPVPVTIDITVTDDSGNTAMCSVDIIVQDGVEPMLNCPRGTTNVPVDTMTCTYIVDDSFASGGIGNCGAMITYTIDQENGPTITGTGASIEGEELEVGMNTVTYTIVTDSGMDPPPCMFIINVVDDRMPSITCPEDMTVELDDNCRARIINFRPMVVRNNTCVSTIGALEQMPVQGPFFNGTGTETFTIVGQVNPGDATVSCTFQVTYIDVTPPTSICDVSPFPVDLTGATCIPEVPDVRNGQDNCDELIPRVNNGPGPRVYQVPVAGTVWNGMDDVLVISVDRSGNRDTCAVVLDASCPGIENAPEFQQTLQNLSADSNDECFANINVPFQIDYCIPADLVGAAVATAGPNIPGVDLTVTSLGINGITNDFVIAGQVPTGTHTILVTIDVEGCEDIPTVSQTFDVTIVATGGEPATFECKKLVQAINDQGFTTFNASDIVCTTGGVSCDGSNPTIIAAFSDDPTDVTRTFTCADINPGNAVGTDIQVTMFIFDVADFDMDGDLETVFREPCFTIQTITGELCPFFASSSLNVGGRVFTADEQGIENTSVSLVGDVETQTAMSEEFGLYAFPSMPIGGSYTITPNKEDRYNNGVSTLDIILMQKHILGIQPLDSPYKLIAADVNNSGSLSALDLVEMRKVILAIEDEFASVPSWQMIDAKHQFLDPSNPYSERYPETYNINSLEQNLFIDFVGVKMGDVNLSSDPNSHTAAEIRTTEADIVFDIQPIVRGSEIIYDFTASQFIDIEGFQFTLNFDAHGLDFRGIEANLLDIEDRHIGLTRLKDGIITFSYDKVGGIAASADEVLFSLQFRHNGNLNSDLYVNSSVVAAQAYSPDDVFDLASKIVSSDNDIILYQNSPNPWSESTEIGFMLPMELNYQLKFYSVSGQLLHTIKRKGAPGLNKVNVYNEDINSNGLIYYELITPNEKTTKRMILLK